MDDVPNPSTADQALAAFLVHIAMGREDDNTETVLDSLRYLLPACSSRPMLMTPVIEAAAQVLATAKARNKPGGILLWSEARRLSRSATSAFFMYRGALALDAFKAKQTQKDGAR